MPPAVTKKPVVDLSAPPKNKKVVFDDDGEVIAKPKSKKYQNDTEEVKSEDKGNFNEQEDNNYGEEEDYFAKREKQRLKQQENNGDEAVATQKWFHAYTKFNGSEDILDMKENEQMELYNLCKSSFEAEMPIYQKRNPSDGRWLQTALHKGTAKDRANAGALLVTSNPLGNIEALSTLIGFTKLSNKSSTDVVAILTSLWKEVLLPPNRKLISLQMRGADWKSIRKDTSLVKEQQKRIYSYWYFENELKDQYFEFLKNLQQGIQNGQENNKNIAILSASQLLAFAPEKEQMLLTMIINKLGDPIAKIASKALHHLTEVAHKHPNMCGVIVSETEKLLFRNNISERAQHFALCFLSSIAPAGRPEVCTKLVHICFALFKVLVQKGAVNNRTMQAILRCLQKAILEAKPAEGSTEILSKDMQDTVYRLVHLADTRVSVQTLGLLLQLISVKTEKSDRFYNALYKKILDIEVTSIGGKTAAQFLHIVHRAIHIDANVQRARAFIKRLLQVALYMPAQMAAGCLIVIHKLLRSRKELTDNLTSKVYTTASDTADTAVVLSKVHAEDEEMAKFDSDGDEKYEDIKSDDKTEADAENKLKLERNETETASSWHHAKVKDHAADNAKVKEISASKYDPYNRVPSFAGAELAERVEILLLREHFHPTVQVFADNILNHKRIDYYGDPLRDFGLPHFLERFAFKNPKKLDNEKTETPTLAPKRYMAFGARGKPVKTLTKSNCTEDEMYIFNFLEHKRKQSIPNQKKKLSGEKMEEEEEEEEGLKPGEVNDDEFETYLDGFFGKNAKVNAAAEEAVDEDELDFLKELGGELKPETRQKKKLIGVDAEDLPDVDADWGDDDDEAEIEGGEFSAGEENSDESDDEEGSIDLDEDENDGDDDDGSISLDENKDSEGDDSDADEGLMPPKSKKARNQLQSMNGKSFAKQLKHSDNMSSLFAAADDFAELLEETGKTKGQGTSNAIFNKDKSTDKQMKWEQKRHSNAKTYTKKHRTGAVVRRDKRKH